MAINYTALSRRVRKLLQKNGKPYDITRPGVVYRNNQGEEIREDDRIYSAVGIMTSFSIMEIAGSTVQSGDMKFICVIPPTETLQIGDILSFNGTQWRVENPHPVMPDSRNLCYLAQVRLL